MAIKRNKPEEIVTKLRQVEVLVGQGLARIDANGEVQITEQTFYRWYLRSSKNFPKRPNLERGHGGRGGERGRPRPEGGSPLKERPRTPICGTFLV